MSEAAVIANSPHPFSRDLLAAHLRDLGVAPGMALLVHSAMSKIGFVPGGPVTVIQALLDVLTPAGTLVMTAFSGDYSDPGLWQNPPVPAEWVEPVRQQMPAYDPALTPTRGLGRIPELFRTWPGACRSRHPHTSFAAWGQQAEAIVAGHELDFGLGEGSPLARLYDRDGHVLLLGVGYGNNTSFHLAEVRAGVVAVIRQGAPVMENGRRRWRWFQEYGYDDEDFPEIGRALETERPVRRGQVGLADSRLFSQRTAVDFAEMWLPKIRTG